MTNPPIEYIADNSVDAALDEQLRTLLYTCFIGHEGFKTQRFNIEMPQHRWIIREPSRIIAHVAMHDKKIGTSVGEFAIGGIAEVAVHPDFRGRGLVKLLLNAAHAALIQRHVPFSMLFGEQKYYASCGYLPVENPLRYFDHVKQEWLSSQLELDKVTEGEIAMVKPLGHTPWPTGAIDLRGPYF